MVKSYSKNANRNMRRPVVKEEVVAMLRDKVTPNKSHLQELERFAQSENIPIIPLETTSYFRWLLAVIQPNSILELGTAIGYSALLMADSAPTATITTIERNQEMIGFAKKNIAAYDVRRQITLMEGDAQEKLTELPDNHFDFVFMDSAKSKYIVFLPEVLKKVVKGGVVLLDDVLQGGDVTLDILAIKRGQRAIYRGLHALFDATFNHPDLTTSLIPVSDGILCIRKNSENIVLDEA